MIALEAWAFDVGQLLAGYMDIVSLGDAHVPAPNPKAESAATDTDRCLLRRLFPGAHAAMQTITGFTYMSLPLALSIAVSIRVGHLLGANDPCQAQVAINHSHARSHTRLHTHARPRALARAVDRRWPRAQQSP